MRRITAALLVSAALTGCAADRAMLRYAGGIDTPEEAAAQKLDCEQASNPVAVMHVCGEEGQKRGRAAIEQHRAAWARLQAQTPTNRCDGLCYWNTYRVGRQLDRELNVNGMSTVLYYLAR